MEYVMQDGNKITWDGTGVYVAQRMRGKTHFYKLPEGKVPLASSNVIVCEFAIKPAEFVASEPVNGWWR